MLLYRDKRRLYALSDVLVDSSPDGPIDLAHRIDVLMREDVSPPVDDENLQGRHLTLRDVMAAVASADLRSIRNPSPGWLARLKPNQLPTFFSGMVRLSAVHGWQLLLPIGNESQALEFEIVTDGDPEAFSLWKRVSCEAPISGWTDAEHSQDGGWILSGPHPWPEGGPSLPSALRRGYDETTHTAALSCFGYLHEAEPGCLRMVPLAIWDWFWLDAGRFDDIY